MKEVYIHQMIYYKKYLFILEDDISCQFFIARYINYDGKSWIKIANPYSLIGKQDLNFSMISHFQSYELKETYIDFILRYLNNILYYTNNYIIFNSSFNFYICKIFN
jgi:hypothetical protein